MKDQKMYWQDVEQKVLDPEVLKKEFRDDEFESFSVTKSRRNFLKIMGFSVSALPLTGCIKIPVRNALPYINKHEGVIPGVANWYATTYKGRPILVKNREGRPIKVEGNPESQMTRGAADAKAFASVLSLYDSHRYHSPLISGNPVEWSEFDTKLTADLNKASGKKYFVSGLIQSPLQTRAINAFCEKYGFEWVVYDPTTNKKTERVLSQLTGQKNIRIRYDLSQARVIASFGFDFLSTDGDSLLQEKGYSLGRNPDGELSRHYQFESLMSLSGTNADIRLTLTQGEQDQLLLALYQEITGKNVKGLSLSEDHKKLLKDLATDLQSNQGRSIVLSQSSDHKVQEAVIEINKELGNVDKTFIVYSSKEISPLADDAKFEQMIKEASNSEVGALFFAGVNPVYNYHNKKLIQESLKKVALIVSTSSSEDETSILSTYVAPQNHDFETWSDYIISENEVSFSQPLIQPLFGSRQLTETLYALSGLSDKAYDTLKAIYTNELKFDEQAFHKAIHDGVIASNKWVSKASLRFDSSLSQYQFTMNKLDGFRVQTYMKSAIGDGSEANNPWLQEMPDPVTKATWDNYLMMNPVEAKSLGIKSGDLIEVSSAKATFKLPALVQPGTARGVIGIALGYGHEVAGKVAQGLGFNAYQLRDFRDECFTDSLEELSLKKTGIHRGLAQTQTHHSMEGRDIVRETTYAEYQQNKKSGNKPKKNFNKIYPDHQMKWQQKDGQHQWAMAIDMNSCTGCSACIVSCNSENNVPVVGRQEVANRREMHWLRIDRYYAGDEENPEVVHMPMLCQHCEDAPCENVCPVLATVHSSDGINQQVYNRCVGTRYCANNCPYKVRRFNWFNYDHSDEYARLALNPDVSIRSRGVMEKCSFCVHRIQEGKLNAKRERRDLKDGDIKTACQQSCPSEAIVFGDMNDPNSKISKHLAHERNYTVLEDLNVRPRVSYLVKVRNKR